jgi:hypothetical protein
MSLADKISRVERTVNTYDKTTKDVVKETGIVIPLDELTKIIAPKKDDRLLYDGYILNEHQLEKLNNYLGEKINPDFTSHYYVLESHGVYNW